MSTRRKRLLGLALGMLTLLFALPHTGWLVRVQFASFLGPWASQSSLWHSTLGREKREAAVAATLSNDFPVQLAFALNQNATLETEQDERKADLWGATRVASLRSLVARYNDQPSLHASRLRYMAWGMVKAERAEENLLTREPVREALEKPENSVVNAPDTLAEFDAAAERGERLDPGNAYFPFMRAVGFYAAHRDADGDAAILRAGSKPKFNDYSTDEVMGRWRLQEKTSGENGTVARTAVAAALLFPHYAQLRAVARIATVRAMQFEMEGETEKGFALRHALTRSGALMRVQSQTLIGNLVGSAITQLSARRPGGAPLLPSFGEGRGKERAKAEQDAYCAYLNKMGHADEVRIFHFETAAQEQYRAIYKKADGKLPMDSGTYFPLVAAWGMGLTLLAATLLVTLLGGIASLLARCPRIINAQTLHPFVRFGLLFSAAGIAFALAWVACESSEENLLVLSCVGVAALAGCAFVGVKTAIGLSVADVLRNGGWFLATVVSSLSVAVIAALCCVVPAASLTGFSVISPALRDATGFQANTALAFIALFGALVVISPAAIVILFAVASRKVNVPVSVGLVRGMRALAVPMASFLLLAYGGITVWTVCAERRATGALQQSVAHEGNYRARVVGTKWPGLGPSAKP